jgi:triosephosphate isomerase
MTAALAPVVIGVSLKMYFDHRTTLRWTTEVARIAREHEAVSSGAVQLVVLPSFTALAPVVEALAGSPVAVGAQDLFWDDRGAFTGEVSGADLAEIGCSFVEVGHAERRRIFGETDEVVAAKVAAAVRNRLTPLLCVGEETRMDPALAASACIEQLESALAGVEGDGSDASVVVAYEPVWAIGAEAAATPEHIAEVCGLLSEWMLRHPLVATSRVIYGGSAGPGLIGQLGLAVDGLFLGRLAHNPANLERVLDEALELHHRER